MGFLPVERLINRNNGNVGNFSLLSKRNEILRAYEAFQSVNTKLLIRFVGVGYSCVMSTGKCHVKCLCQQTNENNQTISSNFKIIIGLNCSCFRWCHRI